MSRTPRLVSIGTIALALTALAGCSGGSTSEPVQLLAHGIVAGNNQVVAAGATQLTGAVVEQLVKNSSGQLSFRRVDDSWRDRALDLVVPRAYAQGTVVNGSPVVGAVVCAVSTDPAHQLVPFTPCTNTGADGKATFFFTPGTGAGNARAEIRGTLAGAPAVFDTASATIMAGPASTSRVVGRADVRYGNNPRLPFVIPDTAVADRYTNAIPYRILGDSLITVTDSVAGSAGARTVNWLTTPERFGPVAYGGLVYYRTGVLRVLDKADAPVANLRYWIENNGFSFGYVVSGLAVTP